MGLYKSAVHLILSMFDRTLIFTAEIFVSRTERTFLSNTASVHYTSKDTLVSFAWNPFTDNTLMTASVSGDLQLITAHNKMPLVHTT